MNQREHFPVPRRLSRSSMPNLHHRIVLRCQIRVVDDSIQRRGNGFKPSVWVLRKPWNLISVIHSIRCGWIEVRAVASSRALPFWSSCRVVVFVVDAKGNGSIVCMGPSARRSIPTTTLSDDDDDDDDIARVRFECFCSPSASIEN